MEFSYYFLKFLMTVPGSQHGKNYEVPIFFFFRFLLSKKSHFALYVGSCPAYKISVLMSNPLPKKNLLVNNKSDPAYKVSASIRCPPI